MKRLLTCAILCSAALAAAPSPQLDELPQVLHRRAPSIPPSLVDLPARVEVWVEINETGHVINAAIQSATDPRLAVPCLQAIRKWRYSAPLMDGAPVSATFVQPFYFGPSPPASPPPVSTPPRARLRIAPLIPEGMENQEAEVTIAINLSADGEIEDIQVVSSTHPLLDEATVDAARRWTFAPAIEDGFPVPSRVHVPFHYLGKAGPSPKPGSVVRVPRGTRTRAE